MNPIYQARTAPRRRTWLRIVGAGAVLLAVLSGTPIVRAGDGSHTIRQAVNQYTEALNAQDRNQRLQGFARAEQLFRQAVEGDEATAAIRNADLFVNLGNAALQAEHIGPAIVAYRQALSVDPKHSQASQNLEYARTLLPDWIRHDVSHQLIDSLFFWRNLMTRGQMQICGALCFLFAAMLFGAGLAKTVPLLRHLALIPLAAWIVFAISLNLDSTRASGREVVVTSESVVRTADSENSAPRLSKPLPSGAEVTLVSERERWVEIQLPDRRTGWVLRSAIAAVTP